MSIGPSLRRTLYRLAERGVSPARTKFLLNIWPPLFGTGIRITEIADDWSAGQLELRLDVPAADIRGAAFGGALFSVTDVLSGALVIQRSDIKKYEVWARTGSFEFVRPDKNGTYLKVEASDEMAEKLKAEAKGGYSTVVPYTSVIRNRDDSLVGIGQQELYVHRRGHKKPPANPNRQNRVAGENLTSAIHTLAWLGMRRVENHDMLAQQECITRRYTSPESCAVTWLYGVLEYGDVTVDDYHIAGLPDVVIEALTSSNPSPAA